MQLHKIIAVLALGATATAKGQSITVAADHQAKALAGQSKSEAVKLVGRVDIIPMGGSQVVVRSNNYGQVTLFSPFALSKAGLSQVEKWMNQNEQVQVIGTMLTVCSERELKQDIMGCRMMDRSKSITLTKQ